MRVGWGTVMMEIGRGQAGPPQRPREKMTRGALPGFPQRARSPRKQATPVHSKQAVCLQTGRREMLWLPEKPRFCLAAESPRDGEFPVRGREVFYNLQEGRFQTLRRVPSPAAAPCPRLEKSGKAPPRKPCSAHLETPTPGRVCASSPVINYRTQGGICKPRITNSTGLK